MVEWFVICSAVHLIQIKLTSTLLPLTKFGLPFPFTLTQMRESCPNSPIYDEDAVRGANENNPNVSQSTTHATKPNPSVRFLSAKPAPGAIVNPYVPEGSNRRYSNPPPPGWVFGANNAQLKVEEGAEAGVDLPSLGAEEEEAGDESIMEHYLNSLKLQSTQRSRYAVATDAISGVMATSGVMPTTFTFEDRKYNVHNRNLKGGLTSFRCSCYRDGCTAKLTMNLDGDIIVKNDLSLP